MHNAESRARVWSRIEAPWDLVVVGGGISGAGIFREAARWGLRVLLVEQADFASGTSSRSSKLVHGGLRYLATGQWRLTRESVRERDRLMREAPGLIDPVRFVTPVYRGEKPGRLRMRTGLFIYDAMSGHARSASMTSEEVIASVPGVRSDNMAGGLSYEDGQTDDARLVWRVIQEGMDDNTEAAALNYVQALEPRMESGRVVGISVRDVETGEIAEITATAVINASGVWSRQFAAESKNAPVLRPLRGSHLVFPLAKVPLPQAATVFHPDDKRPMFAVPWEGVVLFGTTDLDHSPDMSTRMTEQELDYLMRGINHLLPGLNLKASDAQASYAGVRPVIAGGASDPSKESREHAVWEHNGMWNVTGGKLTTFRRIALEVLRKLHAEIPGLSRIDPKLAVLRPVAEGVTAEVAPELGVRLRGRYGVHAATLLANAGKGELEAAGGSVYSWAELRHAASSESVRHLDDLLLRRTRIGLVLEGGGVSVLDKVRQVCEGGLDWDDQRWQTECSRYATLWQQQYAVNGGW